MTIIEGKMAKFNVLHISDVHWSPTQENDIHIVVSALERDIEKLKSDGLSPDAVIFSGDLVWSGKDPKHFERAYEKCLLRVLKTCGLKQDRLFICPGNHDIDRDQIVEFMENGLKASLKTSEAANKFIDETNSGVVANKSAFTRLKAFDGFMRSQIRKPPNIHNSQMLQVYRFSHSGEDIGIAVFNSAWRCTGAPNDSDRNSLIIGERNVDEGLRLVEGCTLKLGVFHHPTDWLSDADQAAVLSRLYSGFDTLFHGHIHKALPEQRFTTSGSAFLSQAGCLYNSRNYPNSYQLVCFDTTELTVKFHIRTFFDSPRREFDTALNINSTGIFEGELLGQKKSSNLEIRKQLREASLSIRNREAAHLDIGGVLATTSVDMRSTFVCPPLNLRRHTEVGNVDENGNRKTQQTDHEISLHELLRSDSNVLFISQREGGKTSLANHISVLVSEGLSDKDRVPVVVSYTNLLKGRHGIIEDYNSFYRQITRKIPCGSLIDAGDLIVIVDDVSLKDEESEKKLVAAIESFGSNRFILMADSTRLIGDPSREILSSKARLVYVKSLPRKAIRELSKRWCNLTGINDHETNDFIIRQLRENNLPRTGYIISLLIWAYQKQKKMERINEAFLLSAVIDNLLSKRDFTKALRREFDPVSAEITLQELAVFLRSRGNVASINDLLAHLVSFFHKKKLNFSALDVMNQLVQCGIFSQEGHIINFKYKCFQEYFIAVHLRDNHELRDEVIAKHARKYGRELYLLSGLRRQNIDLIRSLKSKLEANVPKKFAKISAADLSVIAHQNLFDPESRRKLTAIKTKKITTEQVDDLLDATERELDKSGLVVHKKSEDGSLNVKSNDHGEDVDLALTISDFMTEVSLFGSIVKNSEFDDGQAKDEALRFYVDTMVKFVVFVTRLISDVIENFIDENVSNNTRDETKRMSVEDAEPFKRKVLIVMQRVVFTIASLRVSSDIATEKLGITFEDYVADEEIPLELRLIVSLVLYDVNHNGWVENLKNMIDRNDTPFMLDTVTERLWHDLYNRFENDTRRAQITDVVDHIMSKLDRSGSRGRSSRQSVDRASNIANVKGRL